MNYFVIATAVILSCVAYQSATSLEMSANSRDVNTVDPNISVTAQNAAVVAAISKVNKDVLAILRCNNKNMFYKPQDSTADADGCVGATIATTTTNKSVNLPTVYFNKYPGASKSKKGWSGTHTEYIDLSGMIADGATAIGVQGVLSGFTGNCSGVKGTKAMNIANVKSNVGETENRCHYDNSPNRSSYFYWSYNASTKQIRVRAKMSQTNNKMTSARISGLTASYSLTKTVLKIGDGK